jgi:hypothetical protein
MPVVFSVLSILAVIAVFNELGYRRPGLVAGALLALGFCHINMAQENRPYSLSGLLVNMSFYLAAQAEARWEGWPRRNRLVWMVAFAAIMCTAMMNHYFAGFVFCGLAMYVLICWRGPKLRAWLVSTAVAATLFCAVWGPHVWRQREFIAAQEWLLEKETDHIQRTVLRAADLPVRFMVRVSRIQLNQATAVVGAMVVAVATWYLLRKRPRASLLFGCWYAIPVLAFTLIDLTTQRQQLTHFRYMSVAIPGLCGVLALALHAAPRLVRMGGLSAIAVLMLPTILMLPAQDNPHSRSAIRATQTGRGPNDLLILDTIGWPSYSALRLYQMLSYYLPPTSQPILLLSEPPSAALAEEIRGFDQVYVVSPREDMPDLYADAFPFFEHSDYFHEIGIVYRCRRMAPARDSEP